jgi:ribosomal protein L11 methylase PrmA
VLLAVARRIEPDDAPTALICSGLVPAEADEVSAAFAAVGLSESKHRTEGDWAALYLSR